MAGKINVFNLGALGVNLTDSPLHIADGAWRELANAEFNPDFSRGGVKKRGSLTRVNSVALSGTVQGLMNVPLPLNTVSYLLLALNGDETPTFKASTDGTTWTDVTAAEMPRALQAPQPGGLSFAANPSWRPANYKRAFYYGGDDYIRYNDVGFTNPPLLIRTTAGPSYELLRVSPNPTDPTGAAVAITDMVTVNGLIYFGTHDSGGSGIDIRGRVFSFDPNTGTVTEIGNRFGPDSGENTKGFPMCLCGYQGKLFAGTYGINGNNQGRVYSITPGIDDTWAIDFTATLHNGYIMSLAVYKGKLYGATDADSSGTSVVVVRNASTGAWTTSLSAPASNISQFDNLIVYGGYLWCAYHSSAGTCLIKRFDGTSWTTSLDVGVVYSAAYSGNPVVFKGNLYWPFCASSVTGGLDGFVLKFDGASWTQVLNSVGVRGLLGKYTPDAS
jgi:hypothetical protein